MSSNRGPAYEGALQFGQTVVHVNVNRVRALAFEILPLFFETELLLECKPNVIQSYVLLGRDNVASDRETIWMGLMALGLSVFLGWTFPLYSCLLFLYLLNRNDYIA